MESGGIIPTVLVGMGMVAAVLLGVWGNRRTIRQPGTRPDRCPREGDRRATRAVAGPDGRPGKGNRRTARTPAGTNGQARRTPGRAPGGDHRKTSRIERPSNRFEGTAQAPPSEFHRATTPTKPAGSREGCACTAHRLPVAAVPVAPHPAPQRLPGRRPAGVERERGAGFLYSVAVSRTGRPATVTPARPRGR